MPELSDEEKWMKRLNRKGPFYLYEQTKQKRYPADTEEVNHYFVIWNDKEKTKYGCFNDKMLCRYGVSTLTVLRGETKFDLWNGQCIDDDVFGEMLKVRNGTSTLPEFKLETIKDLGW